VSEVAGTSLGSATSYDDVRCKEGIRCQSNRRRRLQNSPPANDCVGLGPRGHAEVVVRAQYNMAIPLEMAAQAACKAAKW
jgi:hypothetical protein